MVRGGLAIRQQRNNNNTKCWVSLGPGLPDLMFRF